MTTMEGLAAGLDRAEPDPPGWLADHLGQAAVDSIERLSWGFRNETWRINLLDGSARVATRLRSPGAAPRIAARAVALSERLAVVGIPTPPILDHATAATGLLVSAYVDGTPGAAVLDDPAGAALVGSVLGETWRRLAGVDPSHLDLDLGWTRPGPLAAHLRVQAHGLGDGLDEGRRRRLHAAIDRAEDLLPERPVRFVHGDLVPVNTILRDGRLAALLDFESVRLAEPLLDAAWFRTIVQFHHPRVAPAAWHAFRAASEGDFDGPVERALVRILPILQIVELLGNGDLSSGEERHWLTILRTELDRP